MNEKSNKYRVSIYIGKDNYSFLEPVAEMLNISVAALTRIIFDTGLQIVKATETAAKELIADGKQSKE